MKQGERKPRAARIDEKVEGDAMNRKTTRERKDGGAAPARARSARNRGGASENQIVDKSGGSDGENKPSSAIHTVARDVLLPYQVRWIADDAAVKVAGDPRRVGYHWAEAADAALGRGHGRDGHLVPRLQPRHGA